MLLNSPFWIIYRLDNSLVLPCLGLFNRLLITSSINRSAHMFFYVLCFVCWICPVIVSSNFFIEVSVVTSAMGLLMHIAFSHLFELFTQKLSIFQHHIHWFAVIPIPPCRLYMPSNEDLAFQILL